MGKNVVKFLELSKQALLLLFNKVLPPVVNLHPLFKYFLLYFYKLAISYPNRQTLNHDQC